MKLNEAIRGMGIVVLASAAPAVGQLVDPKGDAVDTFGAGPPLLDIDTISVTADASTLFFSMTFHTPISAPSQGLPDGVIGLLEFDTDQIAATGLPPFQNSFSPPFAMLTAGIDYVVDLFSEFLHPGFVDIFDYSTGTVVDTIPITYGPMSFSGSVSLSSLGFDDGFVNFTSIIGTIPQPTDATDAVGKSTPISSSAALDIKPGSCPNSFNRNSHGVLPVALVGTDTIDVTQVDIASIMLSRDDGVGGGVAPNEGPPGPHSEFEDVATPFDGEPCDCHELEGDGITDLNMKFKTDDVVEALELNDLPAGDLVQLVVNGTLLDGTPFSASDCIRLVPPGTPPGMLAVGSNLSGVYIDVTPLDETLDGGGFANFERTYWLGTIVTLTAPQTNQGWVFAGWSYHSGGLSSLTASLQGGGGLQPDPTIDIIIIDDDFSLEALYRPSGSRKPPARSGPNPVEAPNAGASTMPWPSDPSRKPGPQASWPPRSWRY